MKNRSEELMQVAIVQYFSYKPDIFPFLHHSPNGGYRRPAEGAKFKRMGTKAGMPDIVIHIPTSSKHGLFLELKAGAGKLTKKQSDMIEVLRSQNYQVEICRSYDDAVRVINEYVVNRLHN